MGKSGGKFYAVQNGRETGVYQNYGDCERQVKGYSGAKFKSFSTQAEATAFANGSSSTAASSGSGSKYYAVGSGRSTGVYNDWSSAQQQVSHYPNAAHKSFDSRDQAEQYVSQTMASRPAPSTSSTSGGYGYYGSVASSTASTMNRNTGNVDYRSADSLMSTRKFPTGASRSGSLDVYTDGSSRGNGQTGAYGGVGVYFGDNDNRNISEPLSGRQTNQRAELTAIKRALDVAPTHMGVNIHTDSQYAIKSSTEWADKWENNGWKTSGGGQVENQDIVKEIRQRISDREAANVKTDFTWVKGHSNVPGNVEADRLANEGAMK